MGKEIEMVKRLALFDFDGTLYNGDSMRDFARFLNVKRYYSTLMLIGFPYLLSQLGLMPLERVKRQFMRRCFGGKSQEELSRKGNEFFEKFHPKLYHSATAYIQTKREEGVRCVVVSASCKEWLQPFCNALEVELVCTQLEYTSENTATGNWTGNEVKGMGKINAIKTFLNLSDYAEISAFGNSRADKALATIAHSYYHYYFS